MEPEDQTITCPECNFQQDWPTKDSDRNTRAALSCPQCHVPFIVHGYKAFGGTPYTWTHPDVRKRQKQALNYPAVVAFCRLAGVNYRKLSQLKKAQWDKHISAAAGDAYTQDQIVAAIESMPHIEGLENPYMYRFTNELVKALQAESDKELLDLTDQGDYEEVTICL
jgi:hypothetical protein